MVGARATVEEARAPMEEVICSLVPALPTSEARDQPRTLQILENDGDDGDDQEDPDNGQALSEGIDRFLLSIVKITRVVDRTRPDHCVANEDPNLGKD